MLFYPACFRWGQEADLRPERWKPGASQGSLTWLNSAILNSAAPGIRREGQTGAPVLEEGAVAGWGAKKKPLQALKPQCSRQAAVLLTAAVWLQALLWRGSLAPAGKPAGCRARGAQQPAAAAKHQLRLCQTPAQRRPGPGTSIKPQEPNAGAALYKQYHPWSPCHREVTE